MTDCFTKCDELDEQTIYEWEERCYPQESLNDERRPVLQMSTLLIPSPPFDYLWM
jgi:hypothetical protein